MHNISINKHLKYSVPLQEKQVITMNRCSLGGTIMTLRLTQRDNTSVDSKEGTKINKEVQKNSENKTKRDTNMKLKNTNKM